MRNKSNLMKGQSGQILAYTIIIIMLAGLIIAPLLSFTYGSWRAVKIREERTQELYASDAGIEDAMYQIKTEKKGTALGNLAFGANSTFNVGTPGMNDRTETVSVQKLWLPGNLTGNLKTDAPVNDDLNPAKDTDKSDKLVVVGMLSTAQATAATDDFDSGSPYPNSGNGTWTEPWTGDGTLGSGTGSCGTGNCLKFEGTTGYAERTANLLKYMDPQLKFTAKASSFGPSDSVTLEASYNGSPLQEVAVWAHGNETSSCIPFYMNLYDLFGWGGSATSVPLSLRFDANLSTQTVAQDNFSSGNWAGGSGWWPSSSWTTSGSSSASVMNDGANAHSPVYDVKLSGTGYVYRRVNLSSVSKPIITVWAKTRGFASGDEVYLKVSTRSSPRNPNQYPGDWTSALLTWSSSSSSSYTAYTYDLSTYAGQNVWILFSGSMATTGSTFASDDFETGWPNSGTGWQVGQPWTTGISGNGYAGLYTHSGGGSGYEHGGNDALQLSRSGSSSGTASATRRLNVSGQDSVQLQYYARSYHVESSGDTLTLQVSPDNVNWTSTTIINNTSYNSGYGSFTYNVPSSLLTTGLLYVRFNASMAYSGGESSSNNDYFYIDDISIIGGAPSFYFDDVSISQKSSFYVDNLWIGAEYNSNTIEIAYTDPNFDPTYTPVPPKTSDPAYLDRIGVWLPPGCTYIAIVGNETTVGLAQQPTTILLNQYAGGTILEWDFPTPIDLSLPVGGSTALPIVRSLDLHLHGERNTRC